MSIIIIHKKNRPEMVIPYYFLFLISLLLISEPLFPQHFIPVWTGNPYNPMSIIVNSATLDGIDLTEGDEIAVFDINENNDEICVGAETLTGVIIPGTFIIIASADDGDTPEQDGFIDGNTIIYKIS